MLTVPSFEEDPAALLPLLRTYARIASGSPAEALAAQHRAQRAATAAVLARLRAAPLRAGLRGPAGALVLERALAFTRHAIAQRERARLRQSLLYSRCRRVALAIGDWLVAAGRLAEPADVFLFRHDELAALLVGDALLPHRLDEQAALRRRLLDELAAAAPPDVVELAMGEVLPADAAAPAASTASPDLSVIRGTTACGGQVAGRAAVLAEVGEADALRPGDILVTRQTDPAWGPVFFLIRGLVMERGGMLSHGAIIAREFGIPAVVGVPHATQLIATGARIHVDADRGRVLLRGVEGG